LVEHALTQITTLMHIIYRRDQVTLVSIQLIKF